jgi:hypothetical protein
LQGNKKVQKKEEKNHEETDDFGSNHVSGGSDTVICATP